MKTGPKSVWQRLQALAHAYPAEIELEIVGGESGHMGETLAERAARAEPRRAIAIIRKAAETPYHDADLSVLYNMKPPQRRPEGHFTPDEEEAILRDPGPPEPLAEVVSDPAIMSGDPTVKGTRVLAATILAYIRAGHTEAEIHEDFPTLPADGIGAVLRWDAQRQFELRAARADP